MQAESWYGAVELERVQVQEGQGVIFIANPLGITTGSHDLKTWQCKHMETGEDKEILDTEESMKRTSPQSAVFT